MYRVLVPVDTSEDRALAQAAYVASLPDAAESVVAIVLFVFEDGTGEELPSELDQFDGSALRIGSVMRAREYLDERGIDVEIIEDSAETVDRILEVAADNDVEAIVLGGRKQSLPEKALFGSVTEAVIRDADRPVVVTGERS